MKEDDEKQMNKPKVFNQTAKAGKTRAAAVFASVLALGGHACLLLLTPTYADDPLTPASSEEATAIDAHPLPVSSPSPVTTTPPSLLSQPVSSLAVAPPRGVPKERGASYQLLRPEWGWQIESSLQSFGGQALHPSQNNNQAIAFGALAEYQPAFLQPFGVFSLGGSLHVYPYFGGNDSLLTIVSTGISIRYQARFFREQILVPTVAYQYELLRTLFKDQNAWSVLRGPSVGLWLLLNGIDQNSASHFYLNSKILRTYLIAEMKGLQGSVSYTAITGYSFYFGVRFEH